MASTGPRNETEEHWLLKRLALSWAYERGFNCISFEVRAPRSPYRVDVAGYRPANGQEFPIVALFECKQNRPDLDRDSAQTASIEIELRGLQERQQNLERLLAVHFPKARTPSSLFPEWDPFDPEQLPHSGYRRLIRKIMTLQHKLEGNTKFEKVTRYRLANLHFLVAPRGLVKPERVPPGWGLLEAFDGQRLELLLQPRFYSITNSREWLERICKNSTMRWLKTTEGVALEPRETSGSGPVRHGTISVADSVAPAGEASAQALRGRFKMQTVRRDRVLSAIRPGLSEGSQAGTAWD